MRTKTGVLNLPGMTMRKASGTLFWHRHRATGWAGCSTARMRSGALLVNWPMTSDHAGDLMFVRGVMAAAFNRCADLRQRGASMPKERPLAETVGGIRLVKTYTAEAGARCSGRECTGSSERRATITGSRGCRSDQVIIGIVGMRSSEGGRAI